MNFLLKPAAMIFTAYTMLSLPVLKNENIEFDAPVKQVDKAARIQAAILLDVSNSMDGLIEQAKAQLWNMVSVMGKTKCNGSTPQIEIALYEYGRDDNDQQKGYIKQLSPFTSDLDKLSQHLFSLTTHGGQEYCGHVIHTSLDELNWDQSPASYKVIFISGNEDFLQGNVSYTQACAEANKKGVIVNTIYCGDRLQGIKEHWNLSGECGQGSFTNINSDAQPENIPTPYDSTLVTLNNKLNSTYVYYGYEGKNKKELQGKMDKENAAVNTYVGVNRVVAKASPKTYNNSGWDLVDAKAEDNAIVEKIDRKTLPDSLRSKSNQQLEAIIDQKAHERIAIQKEIQAVSKKREGYISEEKIRRAKTNSNTQTLESEIEKMIREQAKRYNMKIE